MKEWIKSHEKVAGPLIAFISCLLLSVSFCLIIVRPHAESVERLYSFDGYNAEESVLGLSGTEPQPLALTYGKTATQELNYAGPIQDLELLATLPESMGAVSIVCTIRDAVSGAELASITSNLISRAGDQWVWFELSVPVQTASDAYRLDFALANDAAGIDQKGGITLPLSGLRNPSASLDAIPLSGALNLNLYAKAGFLYGYFWAIALSLCTLAALSWYLLRSRKTKPQTLFLVLALGLGTLQMFVSTPYGHEAADEYRFTQTVHYHSSALMGAEHGREANRATWQNREIDDLNGFQELPSTASYYHVWSRLFSLAPQDTPVVETAANLYGFEYEFSAPILGTTAARLMGLGQVPTLYLAKFFSLVFYVGLFYLAIRIAPKRLQIMFVLVGLVPLGLYYAGTQSYDAFINALCPLFVSYVLHLADGDSETAEEMRPVGLRQMVILAAMGLLIAPLKIVYVPLLLLPLIIPASRWRWRFIKPLFIAVLLALGLFVIGFLNSSSLTALSTVPTMTADYYSYSGFFAGKTEFVRLYLVSLTEGLGRIWESTVYIWSAPGSSLAGYMSLLLIALSANSYRNQNSLFFTRNQKLIAALVATGVFLLVYVAAIPWTSTEAYTIYGVHGRYFIPILPLLAILCTSLFIRQRITDNILIAALFVLNAYCIFNVFQVALFS